MKKTKKLLTYLFILGVSFISALSYELFIFPNAFAPAGLGGICTMIQHLTGVRVSMLNLLLNVPLAVAVYALVSRPLALRSLMYTLGFSLWLAVLDAFPLEQFAYATQSGTSTILGPAVAGIITGFCYSLVIRGGSYTGGMDFVAALIRRKAPDVNFFTITFVFNCLVAGISYFVYDFQIEPVLLCILYSYLSSSVSDRLTKANKAAIKFEIVTQEPEKLSQELIEKLHHSVTCVRGKGMYSGREQTILTCIINRCQILELESIISTYPNTFAYLCPVSEVVGNFAHINRSGQHEEPLLDDGSDGII